MIPDSWKEECDLCGQYAFCGEYEGERICLSCMALCRALTHWLLTSEDEVPPCLH